MQKVLRKRIVRDLKENFVRYLALGAMIVLCMYIIISLIGTADTIIIGSETTGRRPVYLVYATDKCRER